MTQTTERKAPTGAATAARLTPVPLRRQSWMRTHQGSRREESCYEVGVAAGGPGVGAGHQVAVAAALDAAVDLAGFPGRRDVGERLPDEVGTRRHQVEAVGRGQLEHRIERSGAAAVEREGQRVPVRWVGTGRGGAERERQQRCGGERDENETTHPATP